MIFLIHYDRTAGTVVKLQPFSDQERQIAVDSRLDLEINLIATGVAAEVVLLEAESEEALRKTHQRYFEDIESLAAPKNEERTGTGKPTK